MDIDKIVEDLLEKRLYEHLSKAIEGEFEHWNTSGLLHAYVQKWFPEIIERNKELIVRTLETALHNALSGFCLPKFNLDLQFNLHDYEIQRELDRIKKEAE